MPQTVVGLFLNSAQARKATVELVALGVPGKEIEVLDAYVSAFDQRIDDAGIPSEDASIYKEGVRRGGALVLAAVESSLADRAGDLMDDHGAADIDDLAKGWALKNAAATEAIGTEEPSPSEPESVAAAAAEQESQPQEEFTSASVSSGAVPSESASYGRGSVTVSEPQEAVVGSETGHDTSNEHTDSAPQPESESQAQNREIELPGGVRLRSVVVEMPVERDISLLSEHVTVERRHADREATEADFQAFEQGVMDLVELAEELVISKKARVVEEVVITKKLRQTTERVRESLKQTQLTTTLLSDGGASQQ